MLKIGSIECGRIARQHGTHFSKMRSVQIIAASDLIVKTAEKFSDDFDITLFYKY